MTPRTRWWILGLSLAGLAFAGASTWVHYRLLTEPGYVSPCDVSATFNCTQAYLSAYGSVLGIPVALGGVAWFLLVGLIAAFAPPRPAAAATTSPAAAYVFALATVGLAAVLYLGYASFFVIRTYCLLCLGTYACVAGIFVVSGLAPSVPMTRLPAQLAGDLAAVFRRRATSLVSIGFLLVMGSTVVWFPKEMTAPAAPAAASQDEEARFREAWNQQPRVDLGIAPGPAKVVVVKFIDWLCPSCKGWDLNYRPIFEKYEQEHPGAIKVVVKDFPWNAECNFQVAATFRGHESACDAAIAVRLAGERSSEKAKAMGDWIFEQQETLMQQGMAGRGEASRAIRAKLAELLGASGLDREFRLRMDDVRRDVSDGTALNVWATPTYFVNGVRTTTARTATDPGGQNLPPQYFDLAIKIELARGGGMP